MRRFVSAVLLLLALGCGGTDNPTRASDDGELWLALSEQPGGDPDLEIDFGTVQIGERKSYTIDAWNAGEDPISVSRIQFDESTDGAFYLNAPPLPIDLAKGEKFSVQVIFLPQDEVLSESRLVMKSTGRTEGARGHLKGTGQR